MNMLDYSKLTPHLDALRNDFWSAQPYEHLMIDNFLNPEAFHAILDEISPPKEQSKSSDYIFARNKYENPLFGSTSVALNAIRQELLTERFAATLSHIYGRPLFVDPEFVGGGIHQGGPASYLDMHADFSRHPQHAEWARELNILLYLNTPYDESWGGHLEMRNSITGRKGRISPVGNRLVVMRTKEYTLHGYRPIRFPVGKFRTSLAAYAYSVDTDFQTTPKRTTVWRPENASPWKRQLARISPALVRAKNLLFGSTTVSRATKHPTELDESK